jgi:3',5'-cyclic AMP phosphodiesterase CpdA
LPNYRIVHISDIHFWRIPWNPFEWYGKRVLGLTNLILRRARKFRLEAIPELLEAIETDHPDHLVVSGDISTTSLESEFLEFKKAFQDWLQNPTAATILSGNHDRYTRGAMRNKTFEGHFGEFCGGGKDPFLKSLTDGLVLLGLDPCCPDPIFARGLATPQMADQLRSLVETCNGNGTKTILLVCHYPAEVPPEHEEHQRGHELLGANLVLDALRPSQVPVYWLHGHIHHPWRFRSPSVPHIVYLNPGAPVLRRSSGYSLGRWILDWDGIEVRTEWRSLDHSKEMLVDMS